ncbi:hypothetical protein GCM10027046_33210 [Uliginosibacterium flavum]|uniref:DUF3426 domain-containing protein n=1 Tax=Uliginosibacterium flavum TaxID=1396831 RepID=A0ABV2TSD1_9RHOO
MLTTRCPHCNTVFRIRPEQLSVRGGRVRCGHCQQAFSALSHLEEMDDDDIALSPRPAPTPRPAAPVPAPAPAAAPTPVPVAAPVRPPAPAPTPKPAAPAPVARPAPAQPAAPTPAYPPKEPTIVIAPPRPAAPPARPAAPTPVVVPPATIIAQAPIPLHSPWGPLSADKDQGFPSLDQASEPAVEHAPLFKTERLRPAPDVLLDSEAPVFISRPERPLPGAFAARSPEAEVPAVGDDFSMNIVLDSSKLPANTPAGEDMDFDFSGLGDEPETPPVPEPASSVPHQSALGKALGVPAYDPSQELDFGQTVMLEEPIDLVAMPNSDNGPDSLFFERERQQTSPRGRVEDRRKSGHAWKWAAGVAGLVLLAVLQLSFVFRVELAQAVPELRPDLEWACAWLGCRVPYPQDAEQIALEGHSFNPELGAEGKFRLVVTLLNKAPHQQAWPHLELTVTDRFDIAVARRVFAPADWLPAANASQPAFDGHSEITANLQLAISNLQAAGYRLYVFYP